MELPSVVVMDRRIIDFIFNTSYDIRLDSDNRIVDPRLYRLITVWWTEDHNSYRRKYCVIPEEEELYKLACQACAIKLLKIGVKVVYPNGEVTYHRNSFGKQVWKQVINLSMFTQDYPTSLRNIMQYVGPSPRSEYQWLGEVNVCRAFARQDEN